ILPILPVLPILPRRRALARRNSAIGRPPLLPPRPRLASRGRGRVVVLHGPPFRRRGKGLRLSAHVLPRLRPPSGALRVERRRGRRVSLRGEGAPGTPGNRFERHRAPPDRQRGLVGGRERRRPPP